MMASKEFAQRKEMIGLLFWEVLYREADERGLDWYSQSGMTGEQIRAHLWASAEKRGLESTVAAVRDANQRAGRPMPENYDQCLPYAQARGGVPSAGGNSGAYNILYEGNNAQASSRLKKAVRELAGVGDLRSVLKPFDLIVWDRNGGMNSEFGHIAVVERVERDHVLISQANALPNWGYLSRRSLSRSGVYAYPKGTP